MADNVRIAPMCKTVASWRYAASSGFKDINEHANVSHDALINPS